jgi:hypothetical protein
VIQTEFISSEKAQLASFSKKLKGRDKFFSEKPRPATLPTQFTNSLVRKLAQQGAFFRKKQENNLFGSLEKYK